MTPLLLKKGEELIYAILGSEFRENSIKTRALQAEILLARRNSNGVFMIHLDNDEKYPDGEINHEYHLS
jgi:hypothetical protein